MYGLTRSADARKEGIHRGASCAGEGQGLPEPASGYVLPDEDATVLLPHRDGLLNNRRNRRLSDTALLAVFRAKPG